MPIRDELEQAAFWHGWTCLGCGESWDDEGEGPGECDSCGGRLVPAAEALRFLELVEGED